MCPKHKNNNTFSSCAIVDVQTFGTLIFVVVELCLCFRMVPFKKMWVMLRSHQAWSWGVITSKRLHRFTEKSTNYEEKKLCKELMVISFDVIII